MYSYSAFCPFFIQLSLYFLSFTQDFISENVHKLICKLDNVVILEFCFITTNFMSVTTIFLFLHERTPKYVIIALYV